MGKNVFANGLEISAKASSNRSIAAMPDVCLSPPGPPAGPVPIPYPNSAFARDTTGGSRTVKIGGQEVGKKNISKYSKSTGNEPATRNFGMGVISHNITGPMKFAAWSMDVKVEGANVTRFMDLSTHNHSNCGQTQTLNNGGSKKGTTDSDCDQLGTMVSDHRADVQANEQEMAGDEKLAAGNHTCSAAVLRMDGAADEYLMSWSRAINDPFKARHPIKGPGGASATFADGLENPTAKDGFIQSNLCGGDRHKYRDTNSAAAKYYHTESRILETIWSRPEMKGVGQGAIKPEIVFAIDWQFPRGDLRGPDSKRTKFSPEGRTSSATSCDPCSGNVDSCLGLLCNATFCMDVYVCEMSDAYEVQVPQPGGSSRKRKRATTYQKKNIAEYCKAGKYPHRSKS